MIRRRPKTSSAKNTFKSPSGRNLARTFAYSDVSEYERSYVGASAPLLGNLPSEPHLATLYDTKHASLANPVTNRDPLRQGLDSWAELKHPGLPVHGTGPRVSWWWEPAAAGRHRSLAPSASSGTFEKRQMPKPGARQGGPLRATSRDRYSVLSFSLSIFVSPPPLFRVVLPGCLPFSEAVFQHCFPPRCRHRLRPTFPSVFPRISRRPCSPLLPVTRAPRQPACSASSAGLGAAAAALSSLNALGTLSSTPQLLSAPQVGQTTALPCLSVPSCRCRLWIDVGQVGPLCHCLVTPPLLAFLCSLPFAPWWSRDCWPRMARRAVSGQTFRFAAAPTKRQSPASSASHFHGHAGKSSRQELESNGCRHSIDARVGIAPVLVLAAYSHLCRPSTLC